MPERQESGKTPRLIYVYRCFDGSGGLLYVGMTNNLVRRIRTHQRSQWIWDVEALTAETYPDRTTAAAAERLAIRTENPRWNVKQSLAERSALLEHWQIEATRYKPEWPCHSEDEWLALGQRLRRLTWPIQYGVTLRPLDEAGHTNF